MRRFSLNSLLVQSLILFLGTLVCAIALHVSAVHSQSVHSDWASYQPIQIWRPAHPTNFGKRYSKDINGRPVDNALIIVLHETVVSAAGTVRVFQTPHYNEADQASYHALITRNGTIVHLVSEHNRAFGAGNSVFVGANGPETVKTHRLYPSSVNNFAYHISLETPIDGNDNGNYHSGYTQSQYQSLAWLIAQKQIPYSRITTHKNVDRSGTRKDPRSFNQRTFNSLLRRYSQMDASKAISQ
ncbi:MAG: N-acetylmuramoyl-L-alanine amidase [Acaryochloris sp. RU_4_1]|nr:N-acetylmuramoyl-L-alanine amidase [Acaryochloris sp. SU_5_25]NJM65544.1 N-acetylmuramoyl-L-alanine amidase [Acaryochloris sp. RU_4_1]NJR54392.1 N-acetylmuramoyl-L-alanine amidase [Acaryochloris sp. CRU_2_0]